MEEEANMRKEDDHSRTNAVEKDALAPPNDLDGCTGDRTDDNRVKPFLLHDEEDRVSHSHGDGISAPPPPDDNLQPLLLDPNDGPLLDPEFHFPIDWSASKNPHVRNSERTTRGMAHLDSADAFLGRHIELHPEGRGEPAHLDFRGDPARATGSSSGWEIIVQPQDVILGRGKGSDHHWGNQMFKDIIRSNATRYMNTVANDEKRKIVEDIATEIQEHRQGRFLKRGLHGWAEVTATEARQKISHALQYHQRLLARKEEEDRAFSI